MILYKNVDLKDLKKILVEGILPITKTGNDWTEGKRAQNSKDVVYLAEPIQKFNSYTQYGSVLLEVDVNNAKQVEFSKYDTNYLFYNEYVIDEVKPEQIKAVYIPETQKEEAKDFSNIATFVDVLEKYDTLAIYGIGDDFSNLKNYDEASLMNVVTKYSGEQTIDFSTAKVLSYSNKDKKIEYSAQTIEQGVLIDSWVEFTIKGTVSDFETKINMHYSPARYVARQTKLTQETIAKYVKENQEDYFTKKGDWRAHSSKKLLKVFAK